MIKKAIIYLVATLCLIYSVRIIIYECLKLNKSGIYNKYNTLFLKKNTFNVLVLGSSRAEMHFDTGLFDSLTFSKSYNAGVSGATMRMSYIIFKSYLVNSLQPKTIYLECDFNFNQLKTDKIFNFHQYFPYLSNPVLFEGINKIDARFYNFKYNPFYSLPYCGVNSLSPALNGLFKKSTIYGGYYREGFFENNVMDSYNRFDIKSFNFFILPETRQYLDSFIVFSKKNKIELILTISPVYKNTETETVKKAETIKNYKTIAAVNHLPIIDFSSDTTISNHKCYFEDNYHMMYSGARKYTLNIVNFCNNKK